MVGTVHVLGPADYQSWLNEHAEGSLALQGRKTFLKYRCLSCHGGDQRDHPRAPLLEDLYGRTVTLRDGRQVLADDDYIRRSIYNPGADIVLVAGGSGTGADDHAAAALAEAGMVAVHGVLFCPVSLCYRVRFLQPIVESRVNFPSIKRGVGLDSTPMSETKSAGITEA